MLLSCARKVGRVRVWDCEGGKKGAMSEGLEDSPGCGTVR
jgi:hypothetical protein